MKPNRPQISVYIATSLDGYIARPDGGLDWLELAHLEGEDFGYHSFVDSVDAVVMGRSTYEIPAALDEWAYPGKRVVVLSHTLNSVRDEAELWKSGLTELVEQLQRDGIQHVWIDGGRVINQFLDMGIVDRMTLTRVPVLLGNGIPLFRERPSATDQRLKLVSVQGYDNGVVQERYELQQI